MFARISLFIVLMTWGLLLTVTPVLAQEEDVAASQLYQQGMRLFAEEKYEQAREVLRRVDGMQLPREDRVTLWETLQELDRRTQGTPAPVGGAAADPVNLLEQADDLNRRGRIPEATALYEQVLNDADASAEDKNTAAARLAELSRRRNPDLTRARQLIAEAQADLDAGRLDVAQAKLNAVVQSDVRLSSFDRGRVERQLAVIAERRAELGELAAAAEPTPVQPAPERPAAAPQVDRPAPAPQDIIGQARHLHVQRLLAEGREAEQQGNYRVAVASYQQALELDPQNAQARDALAQATVKVQGPADERGLLDEHTTQQNVRREAAIAAFEERMNDALRSMEQGNFARANESVEQAKLQLDQNQRLFPAVTYEQLKNRAIELDMRIQQAELLATTEAERQQARTLEDQDRINREQQARERELEVQRLLQRVAALRREQQYDQALLLLNQILFIDPTNIAAQTLKEMIEDTALYDEFRRRRRARDLAIAGQRLDGIEATTPYREIMSYPVDWPQLTQRRLAQYQTSGEESEVNRQTRVRLRQPVQVNFEAIQLSLVIDYLRNITGLNFYVNWPALEAAGVSQETPITLQLSNVPAEQAMRLVLQQAAATAFGEQIGFSVIEGVVQISTMADLNRSTDIRIYDIRDLLVQVPNFTNAPEFDLENALDQGSQTGGSGGRGGGGGGGGGQGLFDTDDDDDEEEQQSRAERIEQILELIQNTVGRPEEWEFFGGDVSSVRELNGNLIVRTTPDNHRETIALLDQLREALALQINIEARFLAVSQNFLNEFGIDLDLNITNELTDSNLSDIEINQDSVSLADRPVTILTPASFGLVSGGAEEEGAFRRSFSMGLSYLDDLEVSLLINATQASRRAISLTAPRLTLFNGQRAYVMVARQIAFISDLEPIPDTLGFDVTPGVVNSGVVLDVEATVSADRRYVTLTLRPSLATVVQPIRALPVSGAGFIEGGDGEGIPTGGAEAFIELPEVELTSVRTTVSVPDKGTLLLGGQRLVGEIEVEAGVPVLSKIPVLNRLFTNRSMVKDESTLLILVKPTIIIQSEEEDLEFPGLMDDPQRWGTGSIVR